MEMTVNLTDYLNTMVTSKVASGLYESPSEVVREALRLLDERDRLRVAKLTAASTAIGPDGEPLNRQPRNTR
ncbi:MAG: type II toxin-antitoxin system ParD family antitoxin [Proteobacteria bacterium]|nr:type II toxin-antitoxin system ParD family antitoxin [Pseudomonadota bacterium]